MLGVALSLGASVHAKTPTAEEEDAFFLCSTLSHISHHAMSQYQNGVTKAKNKALLMEKFAPTEGAKTKKMFEPIIDDTLDTICFLPKGETKAHQQTYAKAMAIVVLYGFAEEMDLDIDNLDFSRL